MNFNLFLSFSDAAKFGDIARNIVEGKGYISNFSNFAFGQPADVSHWVPPVFPFLISLVFRITGPSDVGVIVSSITSLLLLGIAVFLLGKKVGGKLMGLLSALALFTNANFLDYATSGAAEPIFAAEIVLTTYLFLLKNRLANILGFVILIAMYFTKVQAPIYILGLLLLFCLVNFSLKKALGYFITISLILSVAFLGFSKQGIFAITQQLPGVASSDSLRGAVQTATIATLFKKVFYNLYNFYKLLPQIMNPYLFALFVIGLFKWGKDKVENSLKAATIFMVAATFLVTALTIPFFRYLHPVVPLIYIFAVGTLVWIVEQIFKNSRAKEKLITLTSTALVFFFVVGQTLGVIFLDSRFEADRVNKGKPPIYVQLSYILKEHTKSEDIVVTNLDTWGSWYGERRTVWYPLAPEMLENQESGEVPFDAIYLTNYLMDDENYYMGPNWREIFENPRGHANDLVNQNFEFAGEFKVPAEETYERQEGRAVLFVKK